MSLLTMLSDLATVQTIGIIGTDRYNQPIVGVTASVADVPARFEQTVSTEVSTGESTVISDWRLFLQPDAVISSSSRVVNQGTAATFEVVGAPNLQTTPRGPHHFEVRLRFVA